MRVGAFLASPSAAGRWRGGKPEESHEVDQGASARSVLGRSDSGAALAEEIEDWCTCSGEHECEGHRA